MVFGFGKKKKQTKKDDAEEQEVELLLFKGALNGKEANLQANAKLAKAGLTPAKQILSDGLLRRAEMIRIEPKGPRTNVSFFVDGVLYPGARLAQQQGLAIVQMIKLLSGLDVGIRKKPQTGGVKAELKKKAYELHVSTQPVPEGERLIVRVRRADEKEKSPEQLGLTPELKEKIRSLASKKSGLFVACGPPFSGTTTTSYMALRGLDAYVFSIFTACDTGGRTLININAFDVIPTDPLDKTLTRLIRQEADVAYLGPLDAEGVKAALGVHDEITMIGEFPAKDAAHGLAQLIQWVGDPQLVSEGVCGVISQKLIRKLCEDCREAYRPNERIIAKLGLPEDTKVLYRKPKPVKTEDGDDEEWEPCDACGDVGYVGRVGIFEIIEMTEAMKELVATSPSVKAIKDLARKEKMWSFQKDGMRLIGEGVTAVEELQRLFKDS